MNYGLITQAQIDALPADYEAAFVEFESICRQSLGEILSSLSQNDDWEGPRLRYMAKVAAAAAEYNVPGLEELPAPNPHNFDHGQYIAFEHEVTQITTRLQIKKAKQRSAETVKLPASRAADIAKYVEVLRRRIEASDFDEKKKAALYKRLEALKAELTGTGRADLSKTLIIIASIVTTLNQAEAAVIKLPDAISAVMKVIGLAKNDEEVERAAIEAAVKPRAIEDQRPKPLQSKMPRGGFSSDLDDEIPF
ncbi:MAG: hypothetical protein WA047_16055 [Phenylobacterium sp.]|uniref:hypothetical protein n=1 Tax=Phenylobacterium sp. TaxID=1871053 RepID=UPI003BB6F5DF